MDCAFCSNKNAVYVCPKCSKPYCSLVCYKSKLHESCKEAFYENEVRNYKHKVVDEEKAKLIRTLDEFERSGLDAVWNYAHSDARVNAQLEETRKYLGIGHEQADQSEEDDDKELTKEEELELEKLLEDSSPDQVLALLTAEQRKRFEEMIETGYDVDNQK